MPVPGLASILVTAPSPTVKEPKRVTFGSSKRIRLIPARGDMALLPHGSGDYDEEMEFPEVGFIDGHDDDDDEEEARTVSEVSSAFEDDVPMPRAPFEPLSVSSWIEGIDRPELVSAGGSPGMVNAVSFFVRFLVRFLRFLFRFLSTLFRFFPFHFPFPLPFPFLSFPFHSRFHFHPLPPHLHFHLHLRLHRFIPIFVTITIIIFILTFILISFSFTFSFSSLS